LESKQMSFFRKIAIALVLLVGATALAQAEDGYELWLRYRPVEASARSAYLAHARTVVGGNPSPVLNAAGKELVRGLSGLLGRPQAEGATVAPGALVYGTPLSSPIIASLKLDLSAAGDEGYVIRNAMVDGAPITVIAANRDVGVLYGAFAYLRLIQTRQSVDALNIASAPRLKIRVLNHWDNLNRTSERGYAGLSLWNWATLPAPDQRYTDYARANASIGINGAVLNNVNADLRIYRPEYLTKVAALAEAFRPYGIKVYLSVLSTAPIQLGGLKTADPLDPQVIQWWKTEADRIYRAIPDFGGFLVKANSEGQPGPQDYGRTQAQGAHVMAEAVRPHGGIVMWRAFVYSPENRDDRAKQAHAEFVPLDGKFDDNVLVQIKNGPLDFQPREPFSPLFGRIPNTNAMMEFQITKEYLGFATHLAYLAPMWEETLKSDTYAKGPGSTVAKVIDGQLFNRPLTGMAGVANTGSSQSWSGSIFNQANWYAFGRLAWNPELGARDIAEEWTRQTFSNNARVVRTTTQLMMGSHQTLVDYMMPLGLNMIFGNGTHYGPGPWDEISSRPDWRAPYYHKADAAGLGFDRTAGGSNAAAQYFPQAAAKFTDKNNLDYLLWFHHVRWDEKLSTGRTLWDELVHRYTEGVREVQQMRRTWTRLRGQIDAERFDLTARYLAIQEAEARWWRDACLSYFQSFSKMPYPKGYAPPAHNLDYYKSLDSRKNLDARLAVGLSN
jgi:alpha-glucuronidase